MCNCLKEVQQKALALAKEEVGGYKAYAWYKPVFEYVNPKTCNPYINVSCRYEYIRGNRKKNDTINVDVQFSYCPFCGEKYAE